MATANTQSVTSSKGINSASKRFHGRLKIDAEFCPTDVEDLFTTVDWEVRSAQIKGENGELIFEQTNCEVPSFWSQLATNVICSKYFYGEVGTPEREYSVRQLVHRVARTIADWGLQDGYFASTQDGERFYRDLAWLCLHQHGAFNSPVWFNVGLYHQYGVKGAKCNWHWDAQTRTVMQPENPYEYPQGSACFIQHVADNMEDIMELARSEAMLFKFGSGTGTDLSTLRSHREKLAGGGKPSGPLSFMRVYDQVAAVVKSGGKTRRAAKMQSIKVWHPDVMEFIECKWKEEKKARVLIEKGGYESNFNGEAYSSIMFQNANLSVRVTDDFMQAVEKNEDWTTHWVTNPKQPGPTYPAREIMDRMADCAWHCGDPGVQYDTTINHWHTCPNSGRINASNPCVTGDTLVATIKGLVPIEELEATTPQVLGGDGNVHHAIQVIPTGTKSVYRLRTKFGYAISLTEDHRVWTENRGDVPAGELQQCDIVKLVRPLFGRRSIDTAEAQEFGRALARGMRTTYAAGGAAVVDACLLDLDRESSIALIKEFFEAQGGRVEPQVTGDSAIFMDHHDREERLRLQLLLLGLGIKSQNLSRECGDKHDAVVITGDFVRVFLRLLDGESIPPTSQYEVDEFKSLDYIGEERVFDLTEPVTNHFVANGIVVHNCSEYMFLDDTACNLASINLMKFRKADGTFDTDRFRAASRIYFIAQEILVDHASYPTPDIARNSHLFRPLGLGYSNLGSLLMSAGMPYDSNDAYGVCGAVTALLHGAANLTSSELAEAVGPFEEYDKNSEPMLRVMQMHREAVDEIDPNCPPYMKEAARRVWDEVLEAGVVHGFRNAQATVLAPTGTISFMMDCDTTGIEPDIALVKYKQLAGGGMLKIVNQTVPLALKTIGYDESEIGSILAYINEHDTIEGSPDIKEDHLAVFDCAFQPRNGKRSIAWQAHVLMMAAAQPFLSGAISKTVNMPRESTPEDIAKAYFDGWKLGLKALAIYRDGSKESQPLSTSTEGDRAAAAATPKPRRERLPDTRQSITHKFNVAGHEGYITVGLFPDGRPGELFITMAKEGSTIGGLMDAFGTSVSMSLQYGVPLEDYVRKFSHMRFEPQGYTKNPDIRIAKSLIDYIFRWLGITFLPGYKEASMGVLPSVEATAEDSGESQSGSAATSGFQEKLIKPRPVVADNPGPKPQSAKRKDNGPVATLSSPTPDTRHPTPHAANGNGHSHSTAPATDISAALLARAGVLFKDTGPNTARSEQFADFQSDAPACDNCGSITVRAGNCYLCHNCGSSMGCS